MPQQCPQMSCPLLKTVRVVCLTCSISQPVRTQQENRCPRFHFLRTSQLGKQGRGSVCGVDLGQGRGRRAKGNIWRAVYQRALPPSQVRWLLPECHRNKIHKYNNTALFSGGCWISLTGRFSRQSAASWAKYTAAGPGQGLLSDLPRCR